MPQLVHCSKHPLDAFIYCRQLPVNDRPFANLSRAGRGLSAQRRSLGHLARRIEHAPAVWEIASVCPPKPPFGSTNAR